MTDYSEDDEMFVEQLRAEYPELRTVNKALLLTMVKAEDEKIRANDEAFLKALRSNPIWKAISVIGYVLLFFVICRLFLVGTGPAPINSHSLLVNILTSAPAEAIWKFILNLILIPIVIFGPIKFIFSVFMLVIMLSLLWAFAFG